MLDGGPSRAPKPVDRRFTHRSGAARRQVDDEPEVQPRSTTGVSRQVAAETSKSPRQFGKLLLGAAILLVFCAVGWLVWTSLSDGVSATIDSSKNQAVFLQNGQTYFGSLEVVDDNYLILRNVFYVKSDDAAAEDDAEGAGDSSMQLIKRGEEVFGPEDAMIINRDQVVYFENIKDDSQVSQLMKDFKADN